MDNILEKIYTSGLKLLEPLTPLETYEIIVKEAIKLINGEDGRIYLEEKGDWKAVYNSSKAIAGVKARKTGYTYTAFTQKKAFVITRQEVLDIHPDVEKTAIRSVIFIPLSYKNRSIGVLLIRSHRNQKFTDDQLNILKLYGSIASLGIRKTQLYDETKQALETRDLFISLAAHELRTPLTAINGYIQLLISRHKANDTEKTWLEHAGWECKRLTDLINELLEINKIQSGKLHYAFNEHSLRYIIDRAKNNFSFLNPERELRIKDQLSKNDAVIGDCDKLIQVVTNLLDNAAKFSPENTPIELQLKATPKQVVIKVKDQGIGIAKKDLNKVFQGFYKGDPNKKGMGLGLYLAHEIIERHHGEIKIQSYERRGTTISVRLPLHK